MNVDDVACVGAIDNMVLSSTIGRNKNKISGDVIKSIISGTDEVLSEYRNNGINIYSGGGETADVGDLVRTIIVDSSITARIRKDQIIDNENIKQEDVIVGLSSFGKSKFENKYNSGIGSNGLTSARHDVFEKYLAKKYPESFDPEVPTDLVYSGTKKILDKIDDSELNIGSLVLSPTRTYTPLLKIIFDKVGRENINGIIHCTGGGQTKILNFIDNLHIVKDNLFDIPPVFKLILNESDTDPREMYKVFNMGHRMEIYTDSNTANKIIEISNLYGIDSKVIGKVQSSIDKKLSISSELGNFEY
jgi:phosphoribosylformylglycinamidine cyclo-ligase